MEGAFDRSERAILSVRNFPLGDVDMKLWQTLDKGSGRIQRLPVGVGKKSQHYELYARRYGGFGDR
jgi:hypothetical protein